MKLVLEQREKRDKFDKRFKKIFGLTFTDWMKVAEKNSSGEIITYEDDKILAGMTVYEGGFKVYTK